ncbi:N utilization substance protein B [Bacteroidia bacterium]|nr:N utilization substance protein B [Bacteroidia bacterium]
MINRIIIRIKVLQVVYAYYQKDSKDVKSAENELMFSLQKYYDLYHYLLLLVVLLTDAENKRIDKNKNKHLATSLELNPDKRFADNRFAEQLRLNRQLQKFANEKGYLWNTDDSLFIRNLLHKILQSDIYNEYLASEDSYASDKGFWVKIFKQLILPNIELNEFVEDSNIYWNDDLELAGTFILKTIKKFEAENETDQALLPMFKDDEDREFAVKLLHNTILQEAENNERINRQINNWDIDRVAVIDLYIMRIALAEIQNFPNIPISVSLNEYIDLARYYSTPKSPGFLNGILDTIAKELKSEGKIFKD